MATIGNPDPETAPEYVSPIKQSKNETRFYALMRYRRYAFIGLMVLVLCAPMYYLVSQMGGRSSAASNPTPMFAPSVVVPTSFVERVERSKTRVASSMDCYSLRDIRMDDYLIPVRSRVRVSGFTYASGGLVEIGGAWIPQGFVDCGEGLDQLESAYLPTVTPTKVVTPVSLVPVSTQTPIIRYVNPSPYPTYTPYPTPVAVSSGSADVNGIWFDVSGCIHFSMFGIREIYVNGRPAAGGMVVCDVRDFRVIVK